VPIPDLMPARTGRPTPWIGVGLLVAAVAYLLMFGALRDRFAAVPDLVWLTTLIALLGSGGVMTARGLPGAAAHQEPMARRRLVGVVAVLLGVVGLSAGLVSVSAQADAWSPVRRSACALAFCVALALLPFGLTLLRRLTREARRTAWNGDQHRANEPRRDVGGCGDDAAGDETGGWVLRRREHR
jgi:hypothetical protein